MRIVATFDPSTSTSDTFNAGFPNGTGKMVVYNESNNNLQLGWDTFTTYTPAWTACLYCVSTNNVNITWQVHSQLASNQPPISLVIVEAYDPGEPIVGTYPAALVRQTNLGNAGTVMAATTSIQNDGNVAGTSLIESTVGAEIVSSVTLTTAANLVLGNATHPGSISSDNAKVKSDGSGNLTVQSLKLPTGSFTKVAQFGNYTITTTPTFFNHNLGTVPDLILLTLTAATSVNRTVAYDDTSLTNTQVKLVGSETLTVRGLAIKF